MARISNWYMRDNSVIYRVGLWFHFNPICTFQDMAQTGIHYEKNEWLRGDNAVR